MFGVALSRQEVVVLHDTKDAAISRYLPSWWAVAEAMPRAHVVFGELSRLLGDKACIASEALSLADILIAPHMDFLAATPEWATLTSPHPNLVSWLDRMNARSSFRATTWERVAELARAA